LSHEQSQTREKEKMLNKNDNQFLRNLKAILPQYNDLILPALKAVRRNQDSSDLKREFAKILAQSKVFVLKKFGQTIGLGPEITGTTHYCMLCFSSPYHAFLYLAKVLHARETKGRIPKNILAEAKQNLLAEAKLYRSGIITGRVQEESSHNFFLAARNDGFHVYLNYKSIPEESYIFDLVETAAFYLTAPWPSNVDKACEFTALNAKGISEPAKSDSNIDRELRRSRQGRDVVATTASKAPFSKIDFGSPMTKHQMAALFETSENEIAKLLANIAGKGILNMAEHSVNLGEQDSRKTPNYYDPLVVFHIGNQIDTPRGAEFKQWFYEQVVNFCRADSLLQTENNKLKKQLETAVSESQNLEAELKEKKIIIEGLRSAVSRLDQENSSQKQKIAELKNALDSAATWEIPESIIEAMRIAATKFSSKLIFHERVEQSIRDFQLNENLHAVVAAVKIFKALAENLYRLKFEKGSFSEEQFRDETGLEMSMTESKASKRDPAVCESRKCIYNRAEITFFPHVKETIKGVEFRVHFQFLDQERKIIICHVGDHLLNARTKYIS